LITETQRQKTVNILTINCDSKQSPACQYLKTSWNLNTKYVYNNFFFKSIQSERIAMHQAAGQPVITVRKLPSQLLCAWAGDYCFSY